MKRTLTFTLTIALSLLFVLSLVWEWRQYATVQAAMAANYPLNPTMFTSLGASPFGTAGTYTINASKNNANPVLTKPDSTTITGVFFSPSNGMTANDEIAVFTFDLIDIPADVTVQGGRSANSRPIALLSRATTTIAGTLDVSGANGAINNLGNAGNGGNAGPGGGGGGGGGTSGCCSSGVGGLGFVNGESGTNTSRRGGAGGSVVTGGGGTSGIPTFFGRGVGSGGGAYGGNGGNGDVANTADTAGTGGTAYGNLSHALQGGSGGAGGSGDNGSGGGGGGGGGIAIGALGVLNVSGQILANGGAAANVTTVGKGGGGAGGGILLHAFQVSISGSLNATGGMGGVDLGGGGGGGRVRILTASGQLTNGTLAANVNVTGGASGGNNAQAGQAGVNELAALPATQLGFDIQPMSTTTMTPLSPAVTVQLLNEYGSVASNSTAMITVALGNNPGGATLGGTLTANTVNGVATFSNLTLDKLGTGYTLTASSIELATVTSNTFNITCPAFTVGTPTPTGEVGVNYSSSAAATPAAPPGNSYQYSLASGQLPSGLMLNATTGAITGTPTTTGNFSFDLKAELFDASNVSTGCSNTQTRTINIDCQTITLSALPNGKVGQFYNATVSASPVGTYTYAVTAGSLPGQVKLNSSSGLLSGTPPPTGTYIFTITATKVGSNCTGSRSYTVTIDLPATASGHQ